MSGSGQVLGFLPIRFFGGNPHVVFAISVVVCPAGGGEESVVAGEFGSPAGARAVAPSGDWVAGGGTRGN